MKPFFGRTLISRFLPAATFFLGACHALANPVVTQNAAPLAADAPSVVINGSGFGNTSFASVVFNNGASGAVTGGSDTQLTVTFSSLPSPGPLTAVVTSTNLGQSSGLPVQVATVQPPVASFYSASQNVLASRGTFNVAVNLSAPPFSDIVSGINTPESIAYDSSGNLYIASSFDNVVYKVAPGGTPSVFVSGLSAPWGLAFDTSGNLYVSNSSGNTVSKVTPAGTVTTFASGFNQPQGLAFDSTGNLYVANARQYTTNTISKVTPTGVVSTYATGVSAPAGLAFDSANNLYIANSYFGGTVVKVTPGGATSTVATGLPDPSGLAFDAAGNLYIANSANGVGLVPTIIKVAPDGSTSTLASVGLGYPVGLAFDPSGNLSVSNPGRGGVSKLFAAVTIPFTVGGTAVNGVDYGGLSSNVLTYNFGQATATISGTLLLNPAATNSPRTLTFTLGTPSGVTLGNPAVTTLQIFQPSVTQFAAASESFPSSAGTFRIPATLSGRPKFAEGATPTSSVFATSFTDLDGMAWGPDGNLYTVDYQAGAINKVTPGGVVSTYVTGLNEPEEIGFDAAGNLYVLTYPGLIDKVPAGGGAITTLDSGFGIQANGMTVDAAGNVYIAGYLGSPTFGYAIMRIAPDGSKRNFAPGTSFEPSGAMAFDSAGNLFAGDAYGSIYKIAPWGSVSFFNQPSNRAGRIAFDPNGDLYFATFVTDTSLSIYRITPAGNANIVTSGLTSLTDLTFDPTGNLYIAASNSITKLSPTISVPFTIGGTAVADVDYTALATSPLSFVNGQTTANISGTLLTHPGPNKTLAFTLGAPTGANLGTTTANTLTITEPGSAASVQFNAASETINQTTGTFSINVTLSGTPTPTFAGGASPTVSSFATGFNNPSYVAFDQNGNAYVANNGNGTVSKVTPGGAVSTFAAGFGSTNGLAFDTAGNLYVASGSANSISKVTPGGAISTFASGLNNPSGLAFDSAGNLYVANFGDNSVSTITPSGVVSTFSLAFDGPQGLAFDFAGNLYVANAAGNTVSMVTPNGLTSTFATGFTSPYAMAFDSGGNLYVANAGTNTVSRVTPSGVVGTFASGLSSPEGLVFDNAGNLFVTAGGVLDKLTPSVTVSYALGGSGVSGIDYRGVASGTIVFAPGQTSATITGTLLPDPGANQTLTFTLSSPFGAASGSTTTNTLSVVEPPPSVTASMAALPINADSIVIQGVFNHDAANNSVTFNNGAAGTVTAASTSSLTVALTTKPNRVGPLMATVTSAGQTTAATQVATVIPVVTPTTSILNLASTAVTISGLGFDPIAANNTVVFNQGTTGTVTAATATQLTVALSAPPSATGKLSAVVTTDGLSSGSPVTVAVIAPMVQFNPTSETVNATAGTFSVTATLTGNPSFAAGATATSSNFATGLGQGIANLVSDAAGNLYAIAGGALQKVTPSGVVTTVAAPGNFANPTGLAIDSDGNIYVSNYYSIPVANNVVKVTPGGSIGYFIPNGAGLIQPTAVACDSAKNVYLGQADGSIVKATPAGVMSPFATTPASVLCMAMDGANNLYVAGNDNIIRKVTPTGAVSTFTTGIRAMGSLAFDSAGYLYVPVSINTNQWEISQIGQNGAVVSNIALNYGLVPGGLAFDPAGNLYLGNGTTLVRLAPTVSVPITLGGTAQSGVDYTGVTNPLTIVNGQTTGTITGTLLLDPSTSQALTFTLGTPTGASLGNATVNTMTIIEPGSAPSVQFTTASETVNELTGTFSIQLTLTGTPTPSFSNGAPATTSTFASNVSNSASASWITRDSAGNFYVSNYNIGDVSKISPTGVVTKFFLQTGAGYFRKEGMAFDTAGNLYVATHDDNGNGSVIKVTPGMVITTFASGFNTPHGVAFDPSGNLFVSCGNNTVQKITPAGVVSTFASGFSSPMGLAFDPSGNLYVANEAGNTVSKVTSAGVINTFATGFNKPYGIVTDSGGNLYVTNYNSGNVSRVTPADVVSTLGGIYQPTGITFDSAGNLYVASYGGNNVLKLAPSVSVQYTTSGTAQYTKDYTGVIPAGGQIVFTPGQTTATLSGTLYPNPGAATTLTITLNTPSGVALGATKSNTMTIVEPAPTVTQSTASLPINAAQITINGVFNRTVANNSVSFNNGAVGTVVVPGGGGIIIGGGGSVTSLTVNLTTPPSQVGPLIATVSAGGMSSTPVQVATVVPMVTSSTADIALNAATLTINGFGFDPVAANNTVIFNNGATGTVTAASATQLTIALTTSPAHTGALTAMVTTDGNTSTVSAPVGTAEPIAEFSAAGESADASVETFSIPVQLTGSPTFDSGLAPLMSTFATGFNSPQGMAFDSTGNLYVANYNGDSISKVTPAGVVSTFASGFPYNIYPTSYPSGITFDAAGNLYVALMGNSSVSKITPAGVISTFVPRASTAEGLAFDPAGNLYVTGEVNTSWGVSKFTPGGVQSTFTITSYQSTSLAFDAAGNLYVGTNDASAGGQVTKFSPDGSTSNLLGSFVGGPNAGGVAVDNAGNVYVSNGSSVSKITPSGVVSIFLTGLNFPQGLAFDTAGNLYVATRTDNVVSKILATSIVPFTVGGTAVQGTDYSDLTVGPLIFLNGQPTVYITGTLIHHPGSSKTLTFTLGTPSGAVLGATTTHTLTILNGPVVTSSTANLANDSATLTINGFGFDSTAANDTVTFNDGTVGTVTAASTTQLTVQLSHRPTGLGTLTAVVNTGGQNSGAPVQIANVVPFGTATGMTLSGGTVTLTFTAAPNTTYQLQYTPSLTSPSWTSIGAVTTNANGTVQYIGTPPAGTQGYYRLTH